MSRTGKTAVNSIVGITCTIANSVLSFVLRALFIRLLGLEYAGINTLFADILNILNLADLGFSNAILFRLYKTISDGDDRGTELYLTLYRRICYIVGLSVGFVGLCLIPFLGNLIHEEPSFQEPLWSIYLIVLANSVVNHVVNYKSVLLIAKQDRYVSTVIQYACIFLRNALQIAMLLLFRSIYLYLLATLIMTLVQGVCTGVVSNRRYHLSWHSKEMVPGKEVKTIAKDVGSLSAYKLCRTLDATIDTFLISKYVDISVTAIYGSMTMLLSALNELLGVFNDGMIASIGDLNAEGDKEHLSRVFYQSFHFTFLIYGIVTATLVPFLSAFCSWWIGHTLDPFSIYIMLLNFLMYGFGMNVATFRNSMGIFRRGWARPAVTAALNLLLSAVLVLRMGLVGTLIGTLLARVLTLAWYDPWLVLHVGMGRPPKKYYLRYLLYMAVTGGTASILVFLGRALPTATDFMSLLWHGILYFVISGCIIIALGFVIPDQKDILKLFVAMVRQMFKKLPGGHT